MSKNINQLNRLRTFASKKIHPRPSLLLSTESCRMRGFRQLIIYHLSFIILFSCGFDVEDPTPPSPPVWVQKSLPEEWPERGIDAHESGGIFLEWEPNPNNEVVAYHVYRASWFDEQDSIGSYTKLARIDLGAMSSNSYIDIQVGSGIRYFYKLKSEDNSENTSRFSDSLNYSLLSSLDSETMLPNGLGMALPGDRTLKWLYNNAIEMEQYCITILSEDNEFVCRAIISPQNYTGSSESWQIPTNIDLDSNRIYTWRIDMNAKFIDGYETSGTESTLARFVYSGQ